MVVGGRAVTVIVTTPGVVCFFVAELPGGETGGFPRVDVDVGLGSCVTRVVTPAEVVLTAVAEEGSWVSRVGVVLLDEVGGLGAVATAVSVAGAVGLLRAYTIASKTPWGTLAALRSWSKTPLPSWYAKELVLLLAELTARVFLAQARLLTPLGLRDPPSH